jgi:PHD/YefM family antitoxin component YafN of YafNO toxin-antitoxin module
VRIEKHGRGVVMVISVEEYERLNSATAAAGQQSGGAPTGRADDREGTKRA